MDDFIFDYVIEKLCNVEKDPSDDISFYESISSLSYTTDVSDTQKKLIFYQLTKTKRSIPRYLGSIFSIDQDCDDINIDLDVCLYYTVHYAIGIRVEKVVGNGKTKVLAKLEIITDIKSRISNIQKLNSSFNMRLYPEYERSLTDSILILDELYYNTLERIHIEDAYLEKNLDDLS